MLCQGATHLASLAEDSHNGVEKRNVAAQGGQRAAVQCCVRRPLEVGAAAHSLYGLDSRTDHPAKGDDGGIPPGVTSGSGDGRVSGV